MRALQVLVGAFPCDRRRFRPPSAEPTWGCAGARPCAAARARFAAGRRVRWGSFVAGGSDSYCYVHQAERWATLRAPLGGRLQVPEPLALEAPWPDAPLTFAPVGHVPSPTVPGAIVPICPAGLSIAMAPFVVAGGPRAAFLVVPLFGALLVLRDLRVGARFGARVGLASALRHGRQPGLSLSGRAADERRAGGGAVADGGRGRHRHRSGIARSGAALAASAAISMRPNLVPLGDRDRAVPAAPAGAHVAGAAAMARRRTPRAARPDALVVALIQQTFYGSPLASGYGSLGDAVRRSTTSRRTLSRYLCVAVETHTPARGARGARAVPAAGRADARCCLGIVPRQPRAVPAVHRVRGLVVSAFLLPTLPLLLVLVVAVVDATWRRSGAVPAARGSSRSLPRRRWPLVRPRGARPQRVPAAATRGALRARRHVRRRAPAAERARHHQLAERQRALLRRAQDAGLGRLDPAWLDRALDYVRARGYEPYLLFERWEEPDFRQRFAGSALAALDWPPMAEVASQVRIYRPDDRERTCRGTAAADRVRADENAGLRSRRRRQRFSEALLAQRRTKTCISSHGVRNCEAMQASAGSCIKSTLLGDIVCADAVGVFRVRGELPDGADVVLVCVKTHQTAAILDDLGAVGRSAHTVADRAAERRRVRRSPRRAVRTAPRGPGGRRTWAPSLDEPGVVTHPRRGGENRDRHDARSVDERRLARGPGDLLAATGQPVLDLAGTFSGSAGAS